MGITSSGGELVKTQNDKHCSDCGSVSTVALLTGRHNRKQVFSICLACVDRTREALKSKQPSPASLRDDLRQALIKGLPLPDLVLSILSNMPEGALRAVHEDVGDFVPDINRD